MHLQSDLTNSGIWICIVDLPHSPSWAGSPGPLWRFHQSQPPCECRGVSQTLWSPLRSAGPTHESGPRSQHTDPDLSPQSCSINRGSNVESLAWTWNKQMLSFHDLNLNLGTCRFWAGWWSRPAVESGKQLFYRYRFLPRRWCHGFVSQLEWPAAEWELVPGISNIDIISAQTYQKVEKQKKTGKPKGK